MTERPSSSDRDRLLADTYHDDWTTGPARALAAHAAYTVRRRRTLRRLATAATAIALLASSAWWFALPQRSVVPVASHAREAALAAPKTAAATNAAATRGYEIISDAELMSYLQDQSVIVFPDANGRPQVVWLIGG